MMCQILLSTFNGGPYLQEQLDSIARQSFSDWHLLVRDDGSTDETVSLLRAFMAQFPDKVSMLSEPPGNLRPTASYSRLLEQSTADYLFFADQDDVWLPDKLATCQEAMRAAETRYGAETPLLIHSDLRVVDQRLDEISPSYWSYQHLDPRGGVRLQRTVAQNVVTGCAVMINRPLAVLATPIPEQAIMHDWWLALVATAFGRVVCLEAPLVLYRQHAANRIGAQHFGSETILLKATNPDKVRTAMLRTMQQAAAFAIRYVDRLSARQRSVIADYAALATMSRLARMRAMLKHRYLKCGILRNLGFVVNLFVLEPTR
ncbi:MAG: glycosyltransferase family 2 protein [Desulfuromonadales bacterium]|nr:glycosyltransferase family 2 protein [Desulfuromonadales bacterium]